MPAASVARAWNVCWPFASCAAGTETGDVHAVKTAPSRLHCSVAFASVWMVKDWAPLFGSSNGAVSNVVSGGVRSTDQVNVAAVASLLPARSVAATENVCWPSVRPVTLVGLEHPEATPSSVQRKVEPVSVDAKTN